MLPAFRLLLLLIGLAGALPAHADVFRCEGADGSLTFSQTPCAADAAAIRNSRAPSEGPADCALAARFAGATATAMRADESSSELYSRYGGFDAMSKSAANIVNYVYRFSHSRDVPAERISALAEKQCRARAFGDFRCEDLPAAYIEAHELCRDDEDGEIDAGAIPPPATAAPAAAVVQAEERRFARSGSDAAPDAGATCRAQLQSRIDAINAAMRDGYDSAQGERYRVELRSLRDRMNEC